MAITYIPREKDWSERLQEGISPYLQMAMEYMLKKKMAEQEQPYEIQKALISGGMAQPISTQLGELEQGAQRFQQRHPQAPYPKIPENIIQRRTPDFTAGNIPFKYSPSVDMALKQAQLKNLGATTDLYNQYLSQIGKGGKGGIKGVSISKTGPSVQFGETPEEQMQREIETTREKSLLPKVKTIAGTQQKAIDDTIGAINILDSIASKSAAGQFKTGYMSPYSQTAPFHKARMSLFATPEQASFKSDLTDAQTSYASAKTGTQRGFKEIAWLEPAMPSGDTPPEQLQSVANTARERMELNLRNLLLVSKKSKYDVSGYEDTLNDLLVKYPLEEYPFGVKVEGKTQSQGQMDYSTMSDEELKAIIAGEK